jgi:ankyrin repeat protein
MHTPLHTAYYCGKLDIERELLDHGAAATAKAGRGETVARNITRRI